MATNILSFWSIITLIIRVCALLILLYVSNLQLKEFKHKTTLQPLKRLLFYIPLTIAITNIPQAFLSWNRIFGYTGSLGLTSLATVSNAIGIFLTAILLLMVYRYRG